MGLVEVLLAASLMVLLLGGAFFALSASERSIGSTLGPQMAVQSEARKALMVLIRELQESVGIVRPPQGCSLNYFIVRDKLNHIVVTYLVKNEPDSARAGCPLYDCYLVRHDYEGRGLPSRRRLFSSVEKLTFTTLSAGLLQIRLDLHDQGKSFALLTAVRLRNVYLDGGL